MDTLAEIFNSELENELKQEDIELGPENVASESESASVAESDTTIDYSTGEFYVELETAFCFCNAFYIHNYCFINYFYIFCHIYQYLVVFCK